MHLPSKTAVRLLGALASVAALTLADPSSLVAAESGAAHALRPAAVASSDWTTFDQNPMRTGVDSSGNPLFPAKSAWTTTVDGKLYGQPLVSTGRVFVGTENDTVYALAADTGAVLWSNHVGTPVDSSNLPCGDIGPTVGITGTPVIDTTRSEIFVVADEAVSGSAIAAHHLIGLNIYTGAIELDQVIDPAGSYPPAELQRASLALDDGAVIAGFGGNDGDCSTYHGLAIATPETGGPTSVFTVSDLPSDSQGAIWMGGAAPTVDASGNVWLATGNGAYSSSSNTYDDSDGVLELSPSMDLLQDFAPQQWYSDNGTDKDLGSTAPALLPNGLVFEVGKSTTAYVLSQSHLGGVNGQVALTNDFCFADGGSADLSGTLYVPCSGGVTAVTPTSSPPSATWTTSSGAHNSPIIAGGEVWSIAGGTIYGLDPSNGNTLQSFSIGSTSSDFPSPSAADGLVLAPSSKAVHAFEGPDGLPAPPSPPPVPMVSSVTPGTGPVSGDTPVTIDGSNFTGATAVGFGSNAATDVTVVSDTEITCDSPAGSAGTVDVTVTGPGGTSAIVSADQFTYANGPPPTPTDLSATLGVGSANLSWTAPNDDGSAITSYTVSGTDTTTSTAITPVTVTGAPPATSTPITGLTPGDSYSFTVSATNALGTGPESPQLFELMPAPYFPVAPSRICDTRSGNTTQCSGETLAAGGTLRVQVTGNGGVPVGATAVVANVTVTGATAQSFLTAYPDGSTRPLVSNLNFSAGQTVPNLVTVPLSTSGSIDLYNASGTVNALVDIDGYYGPGSGEGFTSLTPDRICDTRSNGNTTECAGETLSAGGTLDVQVTGNGGVPAGATAVVANVTVTGPTAQSFLTAYAAGATRPLASNLNFSAGESVPNRVIVPLSGTGALTLYNALGHVNAIVDVDGYFSSATSGYFEPVAPARICDTRASNTTPCHGKTLAAGGTLNVQVTGNGGVPSGAAAVVANATATGGTAQSFLTVYPADAASRPLASDLNFTAGETVPNLCVAKLSATGALDIYNAAGTVNALVDVAGWYTG